MPLYEYECESCKSRFEVIQRFSDEPLTECRKCGSGPVHRLISSPAVHFKGTGWYVTDYAKRNNADSGSSSSSSSSVSMSSSSSSSSTSGSDAGGGSSTAAPSTPAKKD